MMVEEVPTTDQGHTVPLSRSTLRLPHGDTSTNDNERDAVDPVLTGGSASAARIHSDRNLGVETQMSMKKSSEVSASVSPSTSILDGGISRSELRLQEAYRKLVSDTRGSDSRLSGSVSCQTQYGLLKVSMPSVMVQGPNDSLELLQLVTQHSSNLTSRTL